DPHEAGLAAAALGAMLSDERPAHRVSALWVAGRTADPAFWRRWGDLAGRLASLAARDREPAVRQRAAACAARVASIIRPPCARLGAAAPRPPAPRPPRPGAGARPEPAAAPRRAAGGPGPA